MDHKALMTKFEEFGLTLNGKPVSKATFKKMSDVHTYGRGRRALKVLYIWLGANREIFGFYMRSSRKDETIRTAYESFLMIVEGDMWDYDNRIVQWGNWSIPLSYGNLRNTI